MESEFDVVTVLVAIWNAGYLAIMAECVVSALDWSPVQVRGWAMLAAFLIAILTLAGALSRRRDEA